MSVDTSRLDREIHLITNYVRNLESRLGITKKRNITLFDEARKVKDQVKGVEKARDAVNSRARAMHQVFDACIVILQRQGIEGFSLEEGLVELVGMFNTLKAELAAKNAQVERDNSKDETRRVKTLRKLEN